MSFDPPASTLAIAWDQTLVSLVLSIVAAAAAYFAAASVLRRAAAERERRDRRNAIEQVLLQLQGPAGEWLSDSSGDYPQRDMVELERCVLHAQLLFWRQRDVQEALRDASDPERYRDAAERLRAVVAALDGEQRAGGGR